MKPKAFIHPRHPYLAYVRLDMSLSINIKHRFNMMHTFQNIHAIKLDMSQRMHILHKLGWILERAVLALFRQQSNIVLQVPFSLSEYLRNGICRVMPQYKQFYLCLQLLDFLQDSISIFFFFNFLMLSLENQVTTGTSKTVS